MVELRPEIYATARGLPHDVVSCGAPKAPNEDQRLETVKALALETTEPCKDCDTLLHAMLETFKAPAGVVSYFLNGHGRIISSANGVLGDLDWSMITCYWTLLKPHPEALVVEDLTKDARFAHTAYAELGMRAYISAPIIASNGHRVGSICLTDNVARQFSVQQVRLLANFAELTARLVEQHVHLEGRLPQEPQLQDTFSVLQRSVSASRRAVLLVDISQPGCAVLYANPSWQQLTGVPVHDITGAALSGVFSASGQAHSFQAAVDHMLASGCAFRLQDMQLEVEAQQQQQQQEAAHLSAGSNVSDGSSAAEPRSFNLNFRPAGSPHIDEQALLINVPGYVPAAGEGDLTTSGREVPGPAGAQLSHIYFVTVREAAPAAPTQSATAAASGSSSADLAASAMPQLQMQHLLGVGAHASVYKAEWKGMPVAVKVMSPLPSGSSALRQALFEVQVAQRCAHPNIVATHTHCLAAHHQDAAQQQQEWLGSFQGSAHSSTEWLIQVEPKQQQQQHGSTAAAIAAPPAAVQSAAALTVVEVSADAVSDHSLASGAHQWLVMNLGELSLDALPGLPGPELDSGAANSGGNSSSAGGWVHSSTSSATLQPLQPWPNPRHSGISMTGRSSLSRSSVPAGPPVSIIALLELCDRGCLQDALDLGWLLMERCRARAQPHLPAVVHTAAEVAAGLAALHAADVVHGDLSSYNVMLTSQGPAALAAGRGFVAKVADFGMSHSLDATALLRVNSYGTVTHMAPEVLLQGVSSKAADVYSFGVLLWQMLTSSRPWAGLRHDMVVQAVAHERRALQVPASCPAALAGLTTACMAWEAQQRPDMQSVVRQLQQLSTEYSEESLLEDF